MLQLDGEHENSMYRVKSLGIMCLKYLDTLYHVFACNAIISGMCVNCIVDLI